MGNGHYKSIPCKIESKYKTSIDKSLQKCKSFTLKTTEYY